jgi:hypothetical protein
MALQFRDHTSFLKETVAVTAGAVVAGALMPVLTGLSLLAGAPAAALLGGSIGAAVTRKRPRSGWVRAGLGLVGGTLAALGHVALATRFGLGFAGAVAGGALGGLALGTLLSSDEEGKTGASASAIGVAGATVLGAVSVVALDRVAAFAQSEQTAFGLTSATMAGLMGLWVAAGAGARRLEQKRDPLILRFEALAETLRDPVRTRVAEGMRSYQEALQALETGATFDAAMEAETREQAEALASALLDTADNWRRTSGDLDASAQLSDIDAKLQDLTLRSNASDDPVTLGHLARAQQALRAQKTALEGLRVGAGRAEAAVDAQVALLDRLRLAVAQYQVSDRERFVVELSAVSDQVARLSDDLDSLSAAIAEAEAFSDRRLLADVERTGRRALENLGGDVIAPLEEEEEQAEEAVAVH